MFSGYVGGMQKMSSTTIGAQLAADLMSEVLAQPFEDPDLSEGSFGSEIGESTRATFDDVDDYDNWSESPTQNRDGTPLGGTQYNGFSRTVNVANVSSSTPTSTVAGGSSAVKRIRVTVLHNGSQVARLVAFRTRHADAT
jgi:MSHA pilin protein MshD